MAQAPKHTVGVKVTVPADINQIGWEKFTSVIDAHPNVAVRLAGMLPDAGRTIITFGITLGTAEEIEALTERTLEATSLVSALITDFASMDAAFCALPSEDSYEAELASAFLTVQAAKAEALAAN